MYSGWVYWYIYVIYSLNPNLLVITIRQSSSAIRDLFVGLLEEELAALIISSSLSPLLLKLTLVRFLR